MKVKILHLKLIQFDMNYLQKYTLHFLHVPIDKTWSIGSRYYPAFVLDFINVCIWSVLFYVTVFHVYICMSVCMYVIMASS